MVRLSVSITEYRLPSIEYRVPISGWRASLFLTLALVVDAGARLGRQAIVGVGLVVAAADGRRGVGAAFGFRLADARALAAAFVVRAVGRVPAGDGYPAGLPAVGG